MTLLRDDRRTKFEQLCDLTCVDYLNYPTTADTAVPPQDRFAVVYSLLSLTHGHRLWVKVFVNDPDPEVPSVYAIWNGADWPEREVFDLFGICFTGHPDLRRILLPEDFIDYPLRIIRITPVIDGHGSAFYCQGSRDRFPDAGIDAA